MSFCLSCNFGFPPDLWMALIGILVLPVGGVTTRYLLEVFSMDAKQNEGLSKLEGLFDKEDAPFVRSTVMIPVQIGDSESLIHLAGSYYSEVDRLSAGRMSDDPLLSEGMLHKYFLTLLYLRTKMANGEGVKSYSSLRRLLAIPVVVYQIIIKVGIVKDNDLGFKLLPTITVEGDSLLSPDDMAKISDKLSNLESLGLALVHGLPRDQHGDLDFMAMQVLDNQVLSYRKSHPVYGFLAHFLEMKRTSDTLQGVTRVFYGSVDDFNLQIGRALRAIDGSSKV